MNSKFLVSGLLTLAAAFVFADVPAEQQLVKEAGRGRWTFSAGPSWRTSVRMETSGYIGAPAPTPRETIKRDMTDQKNWKPVEKVPDPEAGHSPVPAGSELYGTHDARTEIYGTAGCDYALNSSDSDSGFGVNIQGCYDFYQAETWSVGLNLRFAGYWNMKSETQGYYNAGLTEYQSWTDNYIFPNEDPDMPFAPTPYTVIQQNGNPVYNGSTFDHHQSRPVTTRLRGDLYQLGLGPKITWSPFEGWCRPLSWIDVYGNIEVLFNITHNKLDADLVSGSSTDFRIGFGAHAGLVGNLTDWLGIYGQVGYEWIDRSSVSVGTFNADIDYSSLILSTGLIFRF